MIDIIKVELFRLRKSPIVWVMLGLTIASPLLSMLMTLIITGAVVIRPDSLLSALRSSRLTLQILGDTASLLNDSTMWAFIATGVVLSKEFADGTMRNVILANKSRSNLYFGYLITSLIVSFAYLLAYLLTTLVIIAPIFAFNGIGASKAVTAILCSFALGLVVLLFVQSCMCMFMFGVRKQWATILLPLLICIFTPSIFTGITQLIIFTKMVNGQTIAEEVFRWVPFANIEYLDIANIDGAIVGMHILYCSVFAAVFVVSGYYTFKKADLK